MKTYYTVYKITNKVNGKIYIGCHKTKDLDDNYMGSGRYLKHSIEKHGLDNFTKEILFVYDNPEEMFAKEVELVNEEFIAEQNTYNLKVGGFGGFDYLNSSGKNKHYGSKNIFSKMQKELTKRSMQKRVHSNWDDKISKSLLKRYESHPGNFTGRKHSDETKLKMSVSAKKRSGDPRNNSQYGTMWITDGTKNKKIKKTDPIPNGWNRGRTMPR